VLQSLQRGLAVLDFLAESTESTRTTDIAVHFDIDKANASRVLNTLVVAGYAERAPGRGYKLGAKLNNRDSQPLEGLIALREATRVLLQELVDVSGECAHMAVHVRDKVWYVDKISSPHPLRVDHPVGALAPLHCTALGKAYLAFGFREPPAELVRHTERTIVDLSQLNEEIAQTRRRGFAQDDEEFSPGVRCVAAPILDGSGAMLAAIGLSGPTARIDAARLEDLGKLVRDRCGGLAAQSFAAQRHRRS
jgi:DNA-binding IclR family transcriptional regulator